MKRNELRNLFDSVFANAEQGFLSSSRQEAFGDAIESPRRPPKGCGAAPQGRFLLDASPPLAV
jgi:hypothetical protein